MRSTWGLLVVHVAALFLRADAAISNAVVITDLSGRADARRPFTISRLFARGEMPRYARARVDGSPVFTQCDVKTRWPDRSVQHALLSFFAPLPASGAITVDFVPQNAGNNDNPLTPEQMLALDVADPPRGAVSRPGESPANLPDFPTGGRGLSGWGATIRATAAGVTRSVNSRAMLREGAWRYWLRGPVCTRVIVEGSRESAPTAFAYDFGWPLNGNRRTRPPHQFDKPLHPIFVLTFYRGWPGVRVEYVVENCWTTRLQDQRYDLTLSLGNPRSRVMFAKEGFTHVARSRWRKTFWDGTEPGAVRVDYNLPYMIRSGALPTYDVTKTVSEKALQEEFAAFLTSDRGEVGGKAQWQSYFPAGGGRPDIGLFPRWYVRYLFTFDPKLYEVMLGNAAASGHVPIHYRESRSGRRFLVPSTADAFGRTLSIDARPTVRTMGHDRDTMRRDQIQPAGSTSSGGWNVDLAHQPSFAFVPYLITGDWYFLEELYFWAAYDLASGNPGTHLNYHRHADWGFINDDMQIRGVAWALRNIAHAALAAPDGAPEKAYFTQKLNYNIAVREGKYDIRNGSFFSKCDTDPYDARVELSPWCWGRNTAGGGNPNPLHFPETGNTASLDGLDRHTVHAGSSPWMLNYLHIVLGHLKELGFPVGRLQESLASNLLHQILDPSYNPYLTASYRIPVRPGPGLRFFENWGQVRKGYQDNTVSSFRDADVADAEHGYAHIARAAASFLPGLRDGSLDGRAAWEWINVRTGNCDALNDNPKWALLPRSIKSQGALLAAGKPESRRAASSQHRSDDGSRLAGYKAKGSR